MTETPFNPDNMGQFRTSVHSVRKNMVHEELYLWDNENKRHGDSNQLENSELLLCVQYYIFPKWI